MLLEKQPLSMEELESQSAIELPERDTLLVTVIIHDLIDIGDVTITLRDVNLAVQLCAQLLVVDSNITCDIQQR